jgi:signal transduction histidine kinase
LGLKKGRECRKAGIAQSETNDRTTPLTSLLPRYWLTISALLAAMLIAVSGVTTWLAYRTHSENLRLIQQAEARAAAARIEEYLRAIEAQIRDVGNLPWSSGLLSEEDRREEFHRLMKLVPAVLEMRSITGAGRERLYVSRIELDRVNAGADLSADAAFRRSRDKLVSYGPAYFRQGSEPYVSLAVRESDKVPDVTVAELNLKFVADVVAAIRIGTAGKAYVVDSTNHLLAHPNLSLVLRKTDLSALPQVGDARSAFGGAEARALPTRWATSPEGGEVLTSAVFVPTPGWVVFVEQPAQEVLAGVRTGAYNALGVLAAGLLLAFIVTRLLARRLTSPILQVKQGAERIGAGDLTTRIAVNTGDEVEQLASEFNRMADQLQDYTAGLERKVEEKTSALAQANRDLNAANRHKSEFLANMSHELRTPLNAVIGFSDVLSRQMFGPLNERQREYVADIRASGQHLLSLINDILDLAKIEAGRMELDLVRFSVPAAIGNALTLVRERAQSHGLTLAEETAGAPEYWVADERKFKQILLNLLSNAVKFTPAGGRITLGATQDGEDLLVSVRDTGIGIAQSDQAAIFEEFRQVVSDIDRKREGTGLGLSLVRRFAELHGGSVAVESVPGQGATFTVRLPRCTL